MSQNGKIHLDFESDGFPGQWADVVDIGLRSPKQFAQLRDLTVGDPTALPEAEQAAAGRRFLAAVVAAWHILDPIGGTPLPAPSDEALDPADIPMRISKRITESVQEQFEDVLPKGWRRN